MTFVTLRYQELCKKQRYNTLDPTTTAEHLNMCILQTTYETHLTSFLKVQQHECFSRSQQHSET